MTDSPTTTILAVTGEDDRYAPVRRAALDRARSDGASLVLYDVDAVGTPFESPTPTEWSADRDIRTPARLEPTQLEALGRGPVADQVREARHSGVDAWAWLPDSEDPDALADYALAQQVSRVYVGPDEANLAEKLDVPVEVVGA